MTATMGFWAAAAGPPPPPPAPLDSYTANLMVAYGRKLLLSSYAGALYRVRRSSDNTEQDIAPASDGSETASLTAFVGSNSAFVTKWYDQSGAGIDMLQSTTTKQPKIVNSGTTLAGMTCDGSTSSMQSTGSTSTTASLSLYYSGTPAPSAGTPTPIILEIGGGGSKPYVVAYSSPATVLLPLFGSASGVSFDSGAGAAARALLIDCTQTTMATQSVQRKAGANPGYSSTGGSTDTASVSAGTVCYGANNAGTSNFSPCSLKAIVAYNTLHSTATADLINTALA